MSNRTRIVIAALVAIAATSVWVILVWASDPQTLGNLAEWVAAVGTVSALIYAARQLRNEAGAIRASDEQRRIEADDARRQLELLREQASISRDALVASTRPLLVGGDRPAVVDLDAGSCSVDLRNTGSGPAFLRGVGTPLLEGYAGSGSYTSGVVAVGETVRVTVSAPPDVPELEPLRQAFRSGGPVAVISYTGSAGQTMLQSEVHVHRFAAEWRVRQGARMVTPRSAQLLADCFCGRSALINCGASRIGRALGSAFARSGARVKLADVDGGAVERAAIETTSTSTHPGRHVRVLDVRDRAAFRLVVARRWTQPPTARPGRPPIDPELRRLIVRLARRDPGACERIPGPVYFQRGPHRNIEVEPNGRALLKVSGLMGTAIALDSSLSSCNRRRRRKTKGWERSTSRSYVPSGSPHQHTNNTTWAAN